MQGVTRKLNQCSLNKEKLQKKISLGKDKILNSCDVTFQIYCCNDFFQLNRSTIQYGKIRSNYVFKNAGNWSDFTLQTRYFIFGRYSIISTWRDSVFAMVYMSYGSVNFLSLSGLKLIFQHQNPSSRYFIGFDNLIGFKF